MEKFVISGGNKLYGKLTANSAKNSILPLIAASIICEGVTEIENCPKIKDVIIMCEILRKIGGKAEFSGDKLILDTTDVFSWELPTDLTGEIRASLFIVGALLSRFGYALMQFPGGCKIGERPVDIHIDGLRCMGATVTCSDELVFNGKNLKSQTVTLRFPSVGATENLIMSAVKLKGKTVIKNCAKEPEIVDLQNYLNMRGAKISGAGKDVIEIEGVDKLSSKKVSFTPSIDRIEVGTLLLSASAVGGELEFDGEMVKNSYSLMKIFENNACKIYNNNGNIYNIEFKRRSLGFGKVVTGPYPDFPTDLQPQLVACACAHTGLTAVEEKVFPERFSYTEQLQLMGANIDLYKNLCLVEGGNLHGESVVAGDLRGGASLVIAGLVADGETQVKNVGHIDRGYYKLEEKLTRLGAKIRRERY
ncbi:MAG: UDP-N-acetylglucosamine 1-carboxyvinyltransferase [Clostridiales bacterium]|nr:UDP-N-acetylglucosamine 1-carboxyvinyltransferase [Clostridiales bacterium]